MFASLCPGRIVLVAVVFFGIIMGTAGADNTAPGPAKAGPKPDSVRIAGIVLKWLRMDKEANYTRGEKLIRQAAAEGAQIVVTSEGFLDGYMIEDRTIPRAMYRSLAEPIPDGEYFQRLSKLAQELKIHLAVGFTEFDADNTYNTAAFIGPDGKLIGKYRKERIGFEDVRNTPGEGAKVFESEFGRIGFRICYDRTFPEVVKATCDAGAQIVIFLSGGVYGPGNNRTVQSRAKENGRHMIFVHPAQFLAIAPDGTILEDLVIGEVGEHPPENWFRCDIFNVHSMARGMLIGTEQIGTELDANGVGYIDLPLGELCGTNRPE